MHISNVEGNTAMKKHVRINDIFLYIFWIITALICVVPILMLFLNSVALEEDIVNFGYSILPKNFSLEGWKYLLKGWPEMLQHLFATFLCAIVGPAINISVLALAAYPLSRGDRFIFTKFLKIFLLVVSVVPSGGVVVSYILNINVFHLGNNILMYLLPAALGLNVFIFASFFKTVPEELREAATIDGCTEMQAFVKIVVPLMAPVLATQYFLEATAKWKDYMTSLLYMTDKWKQTLEYYTQSVLENASNLAQTMRALGYDSSVIPINTMRICLVVLSSVPLIIIFPAFQKYFKKGAIVGSVKG